MNTQEIWIPSNILVIKRIKENDECFSLVLDYGQSDLVLPNPGQFNMLSAFGYGEIPISVSRIDVAKRQVIHTIREVGAVSRALGRLKAGDCVGVRGAFGVGWNIGDYPSKDIVVIAGGVGMAPLRPILDSALQQHADYGRIHLLYGVRQPKDILFLKELESWRAKGMNVQITADIADSTWKGHVGVVTRLIGGLPKITPGSTAYVCGPEIMMIMSARTLIEQGKCQNNDVCISMERNMKCAIGFCGHCQYGPKFICKDGPVFPWLQLADSLKIKEL